MSSIQISADALQPIVHKAILEGISTEQRDLLIQQALEYLLTSPRSVYGQPATTPLQQAFTSAVYAAAEGVVQTLIEETEIQEKIREQARKALEAYIAADSGLATGIGQAMGSAISDLLRKESW